MITLSRIAILSLGAFSSVAIAQCSQLLEPMTQDAILKRIKPLGTVESESGVVEKVAAPVALGPKAGEDRYKKTCSVCHDTGVGGAPKFRNAAEWKPRMADGIDAMLKIAIQGKGSMPPRGTCMQCSDEELKMTIEYMIPK